jgi:putative membrane protein
MIQYDPHKWLDHFFDIKGSLIREIGVRVTVCTLWSAAVVAFHYYVHPLATPLTLHTLVAVPLGLLLVFRTNSSYDRYWEGRKLWGGIVNTTRNLARAASVHLWDDRALLEQVVRWTAAFPWATMNALRETPGLGAGAAVLAPADAAQAAQAPHPALYVARRLSGCLAEARTRGLISDYAQWSLDGNVQALVDHLGACERIKKTPLPFAYVVHLRRALVLYCFTLPFALVETFGWLTVLDVVLVAYTFFGIEEIGVEIEGPFGHDENDLPLEEICATIQRNVQGVAGIPV